MKKCTVVELNMQVAYIKLFVRISPGSSVSELMGFVNGWMHIMLFAKFTYLRKHKLCDSHFWQRVYFVDSVVTNEGII